MWKMRQKSRQWSRNLWFPFGGINDPDFMEKVLEENKADFVVVGRQFIADPSWPRKAKKGTPEEVTKCIRCETCISAGFIPHVPFS